MSELREQLLKSLRRQSKGELIEMIGRGLEVQDQLWASQERERVLRELLASLRRPHIDCDDRYYACPALWKPGEMGDLDGKRGHCNCGADQVNARIDAALAETPEKE